MDHTDAHTDAHTRTHMCMHTLTGPAWGPLLGTTEAQHPTGPCRTRGTVPSSGLLS